MIKPSLEIIYSLNLFRDKKTPQGRPQGIFYIKRYFNFF